MSTKQTTFLVRASVSAVQGALLALAMLPAARAVEVSAADLMQPTNSVEVGVGNVSDHSYKFGDYNGLQKEGGYVNGAFDVRGGGAFDSPSATRFRITGNNLGLDNRSMSAEFGEQGRFRISFGYDELLRNRSDSFMSPYNGAGTNVLTLPANWATNSRTCGVSTSATGNTNFNGASNATAGTAGCGNYYVNQNTGNSSGTPVGNAAALTAAEVADFNHVNLQTKRKTSDLAISLILEPRWTLTGSARHETKDGTQAIGVPFVTTNAQVTVPYPIAYDTNQFSLGLAFNDEKLFAQANYYVSLFKNRYGSVLVQDPYFSSATPTIGNNGTTTTYTFPDYARLGEAPDNAFYQFNFNGAYRFSGTTKLDLSGSIGRNTQDQSFNPAGTGIQELVALPESSLHGLVITRSFDAKLTMRPLKEVGVTVAYKHDLRDNRTPSLLFNYRDTDQQTPTAGSTAPTTNTAMYNIPYSKKLDQFNADVDWNFQRAQAIRAGYEHQKLNRYCNMPNVPAYTANGCANATDFKEDTYRAEYRNSVLENLTARVGYARSKRTADAYSSDIAQYAQDLLTRFFMTDRTRDKLRSSLTWQATDSIELTAAYDYNKDSYALGRNPTGHLPIGLDGAKTNAFNLDAAWRASDQFALNAYYTREDMSSKVFGTACTNLATAAPSVCNPAGVANANWSADMKDKVDTYGLGAKWTELASGKLDIGADIMSSRSSSPYALTAASGNALSSSTSGATPALVANVFAAGATSFPDTYSNLETVTLTARYALDKRSALRMTFVAQHLSSRDPATYNGLQAGAANGLVAGSGTAKVNGSAVPATSAYPVSFLLPTNEQTPNYNIQAVGVTYIYSFK